MLIFVPLPEHERTAERTHRYDHIECDVEGCAVTSPPVSEITAKGGLMALGWFIDGGRHRCPKHYHDEAAPGVGPQYRDQ
jgi:hypothetical protein